ncbi:hypothetical protein AAFF39_09500 [Lactococcus garvieae]
MLIIIFSKFYFAFNFSIHQQSVVEQQNFASPSFEMIEEISEWLFKHYNIVISTGDKLELALLCDGEKGHPESQIDAYVAQEVSESLHHALKEISDVF